MCSIICNTVFPFTMFSTLVSVISSQNAPVWNNPASGGDSVAVPENSSPGTTIYTLLATDQDVGDTLTYSQRSVVPFRDYFELDGDSLFLKSAANLDAESVAVFTLTFFVSDGTNKVSSGDLVITVQDIQDESAALSPVTIQMVENQPQDFVVLIPDFTAAFPTVSSYSLAEASTYFTIDSSTGKVKTSSTPLPQSVGDQVIKPVAVASSNTATATITIQPVIAAAFLSSSATVTATLLTAGSVIYEPDFSVSNGLIYSVTGGNTNSDFDFFGGILKVATGQTLDQSTTPSYTLTLQIDDTAQSGTTASATVTVNVDGAPTFTNPDPSGTSTENIAENTATGSVVTLAASDPEGSTLTYSILFINPFDDFFEISTSDVAVKSGAMLNREVQETYTMYFTVTDGTTSVNSAMLVLTLTDVTDESDLFSPIIQRLVHKQPSGVTVLTLSFEEAFPAAATTYSIVGTNPGYFTVDTSGSLITTSTQLVYTPSTLETTVLTVQATYTPNSNTATVSVTFSLDTGPEFTSTNVNVEIVESSSTSTTIFDPSISDVDGDTLTYTMTVDPAGAAGDLTLDAGTGIIKPATALDYTVTPAYTVILTAIDNTDSLSASATIAISLNTAPVFVIPDPNNVPDIFKDEGTTGFLYMLSGTDEDGDSLTYSIISISPDEQIFEVSSADINLKTNENLDYEGTKNYLITVQVEDEASPTSQTATSTWRLRLNNLNDETPTFTNIPYTVSIKEGLPAMPSLLQVTSEDIDEISTTFTYSVNGNSDFGFNGNYFGTTTALTYSSGSPVITVNIQVTDSVSGGNTGQSTVEVTVLEASAPTFSSPTSGDQTVSLDENLPSDQTILTVLATDTDGDTLTYSMPGLTSEFDFDATTRVLKTVSTFDYENPSQRSYTLTVQVTDTNGTPNTITGTITVNINDLNDESPTFSQAVYTATIEGGATESGFLTVAATDNDGTSPNNEVTYELDGSPPSGLTIDGTTGALSATNVVFNSGTPVYTLSLLAKDLNGGMGANTATAEAQITVVTVPVMTNPGSSTSIDVAEDKTPSDILLTASSTDEDGDTGTYSLVTSTTKFIMSGTNSEELRLALGQSLDFDGIDPITYTLEISVTDDDSKSSTGTLTLQVTDINDNTPVFGTVTYTNPPVTEQIGTPGVVATLTVTDADSSTDSNNVITVTITAGDTGGLFSINTVSSTVFEVLGTNLVANNAPYLLTLTAKDRNGVDPCLSATTTLSVDVEQVPAFTNPPGGSGSTSVVEDTSDTIIFYTLAVTDNTDVTYSIFSESTTGVFELTGTPASGLKLMSGSTLDFETTTEYTLVFHAVDTASLTGSGTLTVSVTDANDNAPVFSALSNPYSVLEKQQTATSIVTVTADDADSALNDNNAIQYSITAGNTNNYFSIGPTSGEITAVSNLVHSPSSIELIVVAADRNGGSGALSASATVTVSIEKIPEFVAPPPEGQTITKPENMPVTDVVFTVNASSDSTITLSIDSQTPAGVFELTGSGNDELKLVSGQQFDFEGSTQVYTLVFYAVDQKPQTASTTLTVLVSDVNDNSPVFESFPATVAVLEGATAATTILQLSATDADSSFQDNNVIQYTLSTGDTSLFAVGASSGNVTAINLDYGTVTSHSLVVTASDLNGASGANTVTAAFTVNVVTQPIWDTTTTTFTVQETLSADSSALTVTATDEDGGTVSYSIVEQVPASPANLFVFNGITGNQIDVGSLGLDRDSSPAVATVLLTLQATDGSFSSTTTITINIEDINDNTPTFSPASYTVMLPETATVGSSVINVPATDLDATVIFNTISYGITGGNTDSLFTLASSPSSQINVANALTFSSGSSIYTLTIEATDGTNTGTATVTVSVETEPIWDTTITTFNVQESLAAGSSALTVTATDADGDPVSYSIVEQMPVSPANIFVFSAVTGNQINVGTLGLDREVSPGVGSVSLGLQATDGTFSTTTSITINIQDLNDYTPSFSQSSVSRNILESSPVGSSITSVIATDLDPTPAFSTVIYSITGGNTGSLFELATSPAGQINVASALDFVSGSNSYTLTIQATDGANSASTTVTIIVKTAPVFTTLTSAVTETKAENIPNTDVIHTVSAADEDGDALTYTLTVQPSAASSLFTMGGTENRDLKLATGQSLDFEASNWPYTITFSAEDPDGNAAISAPLTLNITDINDNAPTFPANPVQAPIKSDVVSGTTLLTLAATDVDSSLNDNNVITYMLQSGNSDGKFALDTSNGVITTAGALSLSTPNYVLIIEAADGGTPSLSSSVTVSVTVVADSDPVITNPTNGEVINVSEGVALLSFVYTIIATDADFDTLTYTILSQTPSAKFGLVNNELQVQTALNYESEASYTLTFQVDDNDGDTTNKQTSGQLVINILDENEFPTFNNYFYEVSVMEWQTSAISVIDLSANDQDTGVAGTLTYSIIDETDINENADDPMIDAGEPKDDEGVSKTIKSENCCIYDGDPDNDFNVNNNGLITTTALGLSRNKQIYYILAVQAVDGGTNQRADSVFVKVNVDKFNSNGNTYTLSFLTLLLVLILHWAEDIVTLYL